MMANNDCPMIDVGTIVTDGPRVGRVLDMGDEPGACTNPLVASTIAKVEWMPVEDGLPLTTSWHLLGSIEPVPEPERVYAR